MGSDSVFSILSLVALVIASAFLAAAETAFSALNRIRVKNMAEEGSKRAALVISLHDDFDRVLSTLLVANNVVTLAAAAISAVLFLYHFDELGPTLSTLVLTIVLVIFADITPKSLAKESPEKVAMFAAPLLRLLIFLFTPLNFFFIRWRVLVRKVFNTSGDDQTMTEQELFSVVEEAEHDGVIDEEDKQLIHKAIDFYDRKASDILTPRMNVVGIPKGTTIDEIASSFIKTGYSRLPVYDESLDHIIGVIHMRDFFDYYANMDTLPKSAEYVISPAIFVAPSLRISQLFKLLQKEKSHFAVVTDEYGGTDGIVTMEDILEELVGEIWDESDEVVEEFVVLGDNKYKVICSASIEDLFTYFNLSQKPEAESSTVSGWIMDMLGKIPAEGDTFVYNNLAVTVHKTEHRRVLECFVTVEEPQGEEV